MKDPEVGQSREPGGCLTLPCAPRPTCVPGPGLSLVVAGRAQTSALRRERHGWGAEGAEGVDGDEGLSTS